MANTSEKLTASEFQKRVKGKKKPKQLERQLQSQCFQWFRAEYPQYYYNLFAIPNGGSRNIIEAANMKRSGTVSGVADALLAVPKSYQFDDDCHGLFIEFKKDAKAKQTSNQSLFQESVEAQGYIYAVIYTFEQFETLIKNYLN